MKEKIHTALNALLFLLFIGWCIGWLFIGSYYSNPNSEDLSLTLLPRDNGIINSITDMLVTYDGRYFTNLLHALNPLAYNSLPGYKWMAVVGVMFLTFSSWFLISNIFRGLSWPKMLCISLLFVSIHFAIAPSLPHDLYWMVSSFVYLYPWSFTFLWLGCYIRFINVPEDKNPLPWYIATITLLVCAIGLNEMFFVTNLLLLLFITYAAYLQGKLILNRALPVVFIGIAAILFAITCPGVFLRMADNSKDGQSLLNITGILQSLHDYPFALKNLLKNGLVIVAAALTALYSVTLRPRTPLMSGLFNKTTSLLLVVAFIISGYLMTLAYYLPMQIDSGYPSRIYNSVAVLVQIAVITTLSIFLFQSKVTAKIHESASLRNTLITSLLLLLLVMVTFTDNNISAMQKEANNGLFKNFDNTMQSRYAIIKEAKKGSSCVKIAVIDSLTNPPTTIFHGPDIYKNREVNFWNGAYEGYFGIDEVKLSGDTLLF